ncbi:MAG TPA: phosphate acyltransferase PlsX [Gemmatimonadales bacterium]|nr:phosphate acyltransferase PlsX [Gemmatimonadales bacterium]
MIRIALDAMGGDHAPQAEVEGALQALTELPPGFVVQLVGRQEAIEAELARHPEADRSRIEVHHAPDVIGMDEKPLAAVRKKPGSSLAVGLGLQKAGQSDAFVSAGNTGAVLVASTLLLGLHEGVERATVGALFPAVDLPVLVLDAGATVDCSPRELVGFAWLGTIYMQDVLGRSNPKVGLLNVGEEDEKGNAAAKEAHQLLGQAPGLNYIGNVEGRDIVVGHPRFGQVDIVVCDGFVGNIVLKFYESVGRLIVRLVKKEAPAVLATPEIQKVFRHLDYAEYGGAPLLGVKGVTIMCHGTSSPNAFKNAFRLATQAVAHNLSAHIGAQFARREAESRS